MPPRPPEETLNSASYRGARKQGAVMSASHDDSYAKPVTAMTLAEINKKNEALHHNVGPAETQAAAPELAGTRVSRNVPVYTGAGIGDEVQPTQSDPPDDRSDNLLGEATVAGEHDGLDSTPEERTARKLKKPFSIKAITRALEKGVKPETVRPHLLATNRVITKEQTHKSGDDLAMNTESMPPEGQADAEYEVTRKFTGGTLKGLSHTGKTGAEYKVGQEIKKPIGGSPYKITAVKPASK
jgi:hypothetical protein